MRFPVALLAALTVPLGAGCLGDDGAPPPGPAPPSTREQILAALAAVPELAPRATATVTAWEAFLQTYPLRDWASPQNRLAAEYLLGELERLGYETELLRYSAPLEDASVPGSVEVVRGVLRGADDAHRIALVAHFDSVKTTLQGAYDNGSGTVVQLELCQALASVRDTLRHSFECLFFDAEEVGRVGSQAYIEAYRSAMQNWSYDLVVGFDMVGINWPGHAWPLFVFVGTQHEALLHLTPDYADFLGIVLHEFLDEQVLPGAADGITVVRAHDRPNDELSFLEAGIPVLRFAGGRHAQDYPQYHQPQDTAAYVYEFVGGRPNFERGVDAALTAAYYTLLGLDAFDPRAPPVA